MENDIRPEQELESDVNKVSARSTSPYRLKYAAEVAVIRRDLGGLEEIRNKLGLSRRQITQFLMVDPSAWTRWMRDESKVPPHIYRTLAYLVQAHEGKSAHTDPLVRQQIRVLEGHLIEVQSKLRESERRQKFLVSLISVLFLAIFAVFFLLKS